MNIVVDMCCHCTKITYVIRKWGGVYEFYTIFNNNHYGFCNYKRSLIDDYIHTICKFNNK